MKQWLINLLFFGLAIVSGVQLFVLKYQVVEKEEELKTIHRQILNDKREIHMLKADWALLNDPKRLRILVKEQSELKPIKANQIIQIEDLPMRLTSVSAVQPDDKNSKQKKSESKQPEED